jgi:HSP20 family protein
MEIPGMKEKDLKVEVEGNVLTVSGDRKLENEVKEEQFRGKERHHGAFSRSFTLPSTVDPGRSKPITRTECWLSNCPSRRGQAETNQGQRSEDFEGSLDKVRVGRALLSPIFEQFERRKHVT